MSGMKSGGSGLRSVSLRRLLNGCAIFAIAGTLVFSTGCPFFDLLDLIFGPRVECTTDAECADNADGAICDVDAGMCVECLTDDDCDQGFCSEAGGNVCVECITDDQCDDGDGCTTDTCSEATCSNEDVVCEEGQVCDPSDGSCVEPECSEDADCDDGDNCTDDSCGDGICSNDDVDCGDQVCNPDDGSCVDCLSDDDCAEGESCGDDNTCSADVACTSDDDCPDDGAFCNGTESCDTDAGVCVSSGDPCADGETCNEETDTCDVVENPGDTLTFTTDADTLTGTAADDVFKGVVAADNATFRGGDSADGVSGNDRLEITIIDADFAGGASTENIDTLSITNVDVGNAHSYSTVLHEGLSRIESNGSLAAVTVTNIDSLVELAVVDSDQNFTATFLNSVFSGSSDEVSVEVSGTGNSPEIKVGSSGSDGPETININSTGDAANDLDLIDDDGENDFTSLGVSGDQDLTIDAVGSSLENIDAGTNGTAFSGDLDIDTTAADSNDLSATLGDGDDIIRGGEFDSDDSIIGGLGMDTVIAATSFSGTTLMEVEDLTIMHDGSNSDTVELDLENAQDLAGVTIENTNSDLDTLTLTNLPNGLEVTIDGNQDVDIDENSDFSVFEDDGSSDNLTLNIEGNGAWDLTGGGLDTGNLEMITCNFNGGDVTIDQGDAFDRGNNNTLETVIFNGSAQVNLDDTLADSDSLTELDASNLSGGLIMDNVANDDAQGMEITGGSGNDELRGADDADDGDDTILGNGGNDMLFGNDGDDDLQGGAGNDTIEGGDGDDDILGGADDDTILGGGGNDTIDPGSGNDTIRFSDSGAANVDTIENFDVTNTDVLSISDEEDSLTDSGANDQDGNKAAGTLDIHENAVDTNADISGDDDDIIVLTETGQTSFATAIGTGEITVTDGTVILVVYYDSDEGEAVVGFVDEANGTDDAIDDGDTFVEIARVEMSATEYADLDNDNFDFFDD